MNRESDGHFSKISRPVQLLGSNCERHLKICYGPYPYGSNIFLQLETGDVRRFFGLASFFSVETAS